MDAHQSFSGWYDTHQQLVAERQQIVRQEAILREAGIDLSPRRIVARSVGRAMAQFGAQLVTVGKRLECPELTIKGKRRQTHVSARSA